jgi:hypothetical protein
MVEGITFTLANKEALAVHAKRRMEQMKTRIPDTDAIRNSFRSVKKTVTATGQARFDAEHYHEPLPQLVVVTIHQCRKNNLAV